MPRRRPPRLCGADLSPDDSSLPFFPVVQHCYREDRGQCFSELGLLAQGTVCWRARVEMKKPLEYSSWYFGAEKVTAFPTVPTHAPEPQCFIVGPA